MKLIDNWKQGYKMWSVRLSALGASFLGLFIYFPDWTLYLYNAMPREVRDMIPDNFALMLAMAIFVGSAISRIVKQEALHNKKEDTANGQLK